jgi:hypothetical protein
MWQCRQFDPLPNPGICFLSMLADRVERLLHRLFLRSVAEILRVNLNFIYNVKFKFTINFMPMCKRAYMIRLDA